MDYMDGRREYVARVRDSFAGNDVSDVYEAKRGIFFICKIVVFDRIAVVWYILLLQDQ